MNVNAIKQRCSIVDLTHIESQYYTALLQGQCGWRALLPGAPLQPLRPHHQLQSLPGSLPSLPGSLPPQWWKQAGVHVLSTQDSEGEIAFYLCRNKSKFWSHDFRWYGNQFKLKRRIFLTSSRPLISTRGNISGCLRCSTKPEPKEILRRGDTFYRGWPVIGSTTSVKNMVWTISASTKVLPSKAGTRTFQYERATRTTFI